MIIDKIVFSAKGKVQELLLCGATLDLPKAVDICYAYEQSTEQLKEMSSSGKIDRVVKVNNHPSFFLRKSTREQKGNSDST